MTEKTYTECMAAMQSVFGSIAQERFAALYNAMKEISDREFKAATGRIIKTFSPTSSKPFPVPADFYQAGEYADEYGHAIRHTPNQFVRLPDVEDTQERRDAIRKCADDMARIAQKWTM